MKYYQKSLEAKISNLIGFIFLGIFSCFVLLLTVNIFTAIFDPGNRSSALAFAIVLIVFSFFILWSTVFLLLLYPNFEVKKDGLWVGKGVLGKQLSWTRGFSLTRVKDTKLVIEINSKGLLLYRLYGLIHGKWDKPTIAFWGDKSIVNNLEAEIRNHISFYDA